MNKYDLSIVIPARKEMFLARTIQDILENMEANTEIIAVLDGDWSDPPIPQHDRVNVIYVPEAIGQRAATNLGVRLAKGKYVLKCDAHCSFDKGFDRIMLEGFKEVGDNVTMVPIMRNLWAFDWKCMSCGKKTYQGPTPTKPCAGIKRDKAVCGAINYKRKMIWTGKHNPQSWSYCFDSTPHFQYYEEYKHRPGIRDNAKKTGFSETMSLQGSCFMATREKYRELELCGENLGSWGNQGIEVSVKTWLSGGRVLVNHRTWYAHMFRTQGGDFSFPYPQSGREVQKTKKKVTNMFFENKWEKQIYPLSKIIEQFWPVKGWSEEAYQKIKQDELKCERSGIYSIKNKKTGNIYIGSSKKLSQRFFEHLHSLKCGKHDNDFLQKSWNKYGKDNFSFNIEYFCDKENLMLEEQRIIDEHSEKIGWRNMFNVCTLALPGFSGEHTEETKRKIGEKSKGRQTFLNKTHSLESIEKMRISSLGATPWNKGVPWPEEVRERISKSRIGIVAWNKGLTKDTDERVNSYSEKRIGINPWENKEHPRGMLGKNHTDEVKQKISESVRATKQKIREDATMILPKERDGKE